MIAPVQLAVFALADQQFGVPLDKVDRVVCAAYVTPLPRAPAAVLGIIDIHGMVIPVFDVRARLGLTARSIGLDDHFVIVRTSNRTVALVVDRVTSVVASVDRTVVPAEEILPRWHEMTGAVQLEGGLTLIYDLDRFLSLEEDRLLESALRERGDDGN